MSSLRSRVSYEDECTQTSCLAQACGSKESLRDSLLAARSLVARSIVESLTRRVVSASALPRTRFAREPGPIVGLLNRRCRGYRPPSANRGGWINMVNQESNYIFHILGYHTGLIRSGVVGAAGRSFSWGI